MDRSHFSCPVLLLHPTGSSGALRPKTRSSNLTRDTETEPPNPHPTTTTTGSPSPPSTCFQPCFVPSTLALTPPQLSSQASYPTLHPISFPLTITSTTQSPHGSVSSCTISTFSFFITAPYKRPIYLYPQRLCSPPGSGRAIRSPPVLCLVPIQASRDSPSPTAPVPQVPLSPNRGFSP